VSIARHTSYNFAGAAVPLAVSLITVPIYLSMVGTDRYGVLAICWLLLGYFNLFDLGLGRATAQKIATLADASGHERSRIFWTSLILSGGLSLVAMALVAPAGYFGLRLLNVNNPALRAEFIGALPWLVAATPFGILNGLLVGALEGRREFLKVNLANSVGTIATSVLPLGAALVFGPELSHLLAASLLGRAIAICLLAAVCIGAVPVQRPGGLVRTEMGQLLRFGGWTTISSVIGPILTFWDRFAIGVMISSAAVALYVIPFNLVSQLAVVPAALATALFPRLAAAGAGEARALGDESLQVLAFVLAPATLLSMVAAGLLLPLWLGARTASEVSPVAYILLFGFWANGLARLPFAQLQAERRPDLLAKAHLAELIPYVAFLYIGLRVAGINGAAIAWSMRVTADAVILFTLTGISRSAIKTLLGQGLLLAIAVVTAVSLPTDAPERWLIHVGLLSILITLGMRNPPRKIVEYLELGIRSLSRIRSRRMSGKLGSPRQDHDAE